MTRIGITGHATMKPETRRVVAAELAAHLADRDEVVGWTSLADGADQMFAWAVLAAGGEYVFVQPSDDIEAGFDPTRVAHFRAARSLAAAIVAMPFATRCEDAYFAAGKRIVDEVDEMIAIHDGGPAKGLGGTADIVEYCKEIGRPYTVYWPRGHERP